MDRHLSDRRDWLPGGDEPTFADITMAAAIAFPNFPVNATPLDEGFEHDDGCSALDAPPAFLAAYADPNSGVPELDNRT
ncbi:glutathione S-transferase [Novosphingobium chloroacetimidivorans]|uniref:Glutathione S-transferase n=1 Tax=Novosphingobium chloroacetimidivorans TaxID=1428314 RepID=A0A7W7KDQ3_9SPHN|nr:glutathione S-transferase domain-containing protein [Novosphingobium chloroacetimidivorans]MBB4860951.1 glutathione S-transferase [Novosphingobium chloroacetimidivorans]